MNQIVVLAALGDGGGGGSGSRSLDRLLLELDRHGEVCLERDGGDARRKAMTGLGGRREMRVEGVCCRSCCAVGVDRGRQLGSAQGYLAPPQPAPARRPAFSGFGALRRAGKSNGPLNAGKHAAFTNKTTRPRYSTAPALHLIASAIFVFNGIRLPRGLRCPAHFVCRARRLIGRAICCETPAVRAQRTPPARQSACWAKRCGRTSSAARLRPRGRRRRAAAEGIAVGEGALGILHAVNARPECAAVSR